MNEFIPASRQPNPENTEPSGAQPTTRSHWDIWNKPGTVGAVGIPGASGAQVSGSPPRLATSGEFDAWSTTKPSVFLSGEEANRNDYHYQENVRKFSLFVLINRAAILLGVLPHFIQDFSKVDIGRRPPLKLQH